MKVFDCFIFFNELDLLEFRLRFLNDHVDYFVIAESNLNFHGKSKPYYFREAKERFKQWEDRIIYIPLQQNAEGLQFNIENSYNPESASFKLEHQQRNALLQADHLIGDDDLVLLGDIDELPDLTVFKKLKTTALPLALSLLFHYYYMNYQNTGVSRWWNGCIAATGRQFKDIGPQGLRNNRDVYPSLGAAGWHFSFLGGVEEIRNKLRSYSHTEYSKEEYLDEKHITASIMNGKDVLKREGLIFKLMPLSYYPARLQRFMKMYPQFILPKKSGFFKDCFYFMRRLSKGNL